MIEIIPDRPPIDRAAYHELPLGAVTPRGWLRDQLRLQADGFTGHLGDVWPDVGENSAWLGGDGEDWERGPYYCDGLIPLAHLLGDERLIALASRWVEWTLGSQRPDGFFGPTTNDDWWPRMVMLKVLTQHAEATDDERVVAFMSRYFAYQRAQLGDRPLEKWGQARGAENVLSILWLYNRSGDRDLLDLAALITRQTLDWGAHLTRFPCRDRQTTFDHLIHVVNVAMGVKEPALRYLLTGDQRHHQAVYAALANLDRWHGQPQGMFSGDEWLAGTDPSQGVELCAVVELAFTLEHLVRIFGEVAQADRLERVIYNALPATITADMRGRQYDQQPNQVLCSVARRNWTQNKDDSNIFGLEPNFGCCTANLHQGWPKFARALWHATPDGGLVASAYAPCQVQVMLGDTAVTIDEETDYPFDDTIRLRVGLNRPSSFPLVLRVPEWCDSARLTVNGEPIAGFDTPGFHRLDRLWRDGDVIEIALPMPVRLAERPSGGVSVERGPLVFALRLGEDWRKIGREEPFADWEIHPTTPWNYALAVDSAAPERSLAVERREVSRIPFAGDAPPIILRARGRRVPDWKLVDNSAGPLPASPVQAGTPLEDVELIPYGSARLRVTEMPTTSGD